MSTRTHTKIPTDYRGCRVAKGKRYALYIRDEWTCPYCSRDLGLGNVADYERTLDHIRPNSKGGSTDSANLVLCCNSCNSARGSKSVREFAYYLAGGLNYSPENAEVFVAKVVTRINKRRRRSYAKARRMVRELLGF